MTIEQIAQQVLDLRNEDVEALAALADVETDAFAAFASEYMAIHPPCKGCHF
jgi:hypothetical protein